MRVNGTGQSRPLGGVQRSTRRDGAAGGEAFRIASAEAHDGVAPVAGGGAVTPAGALLALQEVNDQDGGRKRALQRADNLLDMLDNLRHALLAGTIAPERLRRLLKLARERRDTVADPQLEALLSEIELRAAVELAKFDQAALSRA